MTLLCLLLLLTIRLLLYSCIGVTRRGYSTAASLHHIMPGTRSNTQARYLGVRLVAPVPLQRLSAPAWSLHLRPRTAKSQAPDTAGPAGRVTRYFPREKASRRSLEGAGKILLRRAGHQSSDLKRRVRIKGTCRTSRHPHFLWSGSPQPSL